jgi:hypothetical protein
MPKSANAKERECQRARMPKSASHKGAFGGHPEGSEGSLSANGSSTTVMGKRSFVAPFLRTMGIVHAFRRSSRLSAQFTPFRRSSRLSASSGICAVRHLRRSAFAPFGIQRR